MNKKLISITLMLIFCITLIAPVTTITYATSNNISDALEKIQNSSGTGDMEDAKTDISNLGKDAIDIILIIVWIGITIRGFLTGLKLASAGDDASKKAKLKMELAFHIAGIIFLANYFGILNFAFNKIKIFK